MFRFRMPLRVAGLQTALLRLNPDLQKMDWLGAGRIKLAVRDAPARAHQLNLAGLELPAIAQAVLVLQRAFQHVAENLHVAVRMRPEAQARRNPVVVDDAQGAEAHVRRIIIVREGKGVIRIEPAVVSVAALGGSAGVQFSRCRCHANTMAARCRAS